MARNRNKTYRPLREESEKTTQTPPLEEESLAEESLMGNESVLDKVAVDVRMTDKATDTSAVNEEQLPLPSSNVGILTPDLPDMKAEDLDEESLPTPAWGEVEALKDRVSLSTVIDQLPRGDDPEMSTDALPLVNPAQNFTSDATIKAWESPESAPSANNLMYPILVSVLDRYEKEMRPKKPMTAQEGAQHQEVLYQTIVRVTQTKVGFRENWKYLLGRFYENPNDVYSIKYIMRFLDKMKATKQDIVLFRQLLNLIIQTCDPKDMVANVRKVSLEKTLAGVSSSNMRNNIMNYYRPLVG